MGVEIFLKLAGIAGDSLDPGHKAEIELISWSWASSRPASGSGGAAQSAPGEMVCTKTTDIASNALSNYAVTGRVISDGALSVTQVGDNEADLLTLTMNDIVITKLQRLSMAGGGTGEQFSVIFSSFSTKSAYHAIGPVSATGMAYSRDP